MTRAIWGIGNWLGQGICKTHLTLTQFSVPLIPNTLIDHVLQREEATRAALPIETIQVLQNYLRLERPLTNSPALFVSLKGRQRGHHIERASGTLRFGFAA